MAKKNLGKFLALTAISTAIAAGVSYFLKYRSFHAELDEDFHDFEGDDDTFDGALPHEGEAATRNDVPLGEKKEESSLKEAAEAVKDAAAEAVKTVSEKAEDAAVLAAEEASEHIAETAEQVKKAAADTATTIVDDISGE